MRSCGHLADGSGDRFGGIRGRLFPARYAQGQEGVQGCQRGLRGGRTTAKPLSLYEEVIADEPGGGSRLFLPGEQLRQHVQADRPDDPANRANIEKAVNYYQMSADKLADGGQPRSQAPPAALVPVPGRRLRRGPAERPGKAEPIIQKMIQIEPGEPTNYFRLARLYEDAGVYDEAEAMYLRAKEVKPNDPAVYMTLAAYYNRRGEFDKTIKALEERAAKEPNNPEAFHTIASYYWDETRNDPKLRDEREARLHPEGHPGGRPRDSS